MNMTKQKIEPHVIFSPSAMPQNDEDEASRDWIQPQTETPSDSNAQHYPQQHHHRQQDEPFIVHTL